MKGEHYMQEKSKINPKSEPAGEKKGNTAASAIELTSVAQEVFSQIAKSTSRVVQQAASILEEEVAAGIVAAKEVEGKLFDTRDIRKENKEVLFSRFRKDAHEVVDIFMDLVGVAAKYGINLTQRMITFTVPGTKTEEAPVSDVPKLEMPEPMKPGTETEVPMELENKSREVTDVFSMYCTDLISSQGKRIAAGNITFAPDTIKIGPGQTARVTVKVSVPRTTPAGSYSGLVQATNLYQLRAILIIRVV
ncbi:MAG: hypothetical protein PHD25_04995 [Bacteroidales bacterium]|nr:hypothetical protein [Bacteroidales bacterium]